MAERAYALCWIPLAGRAMLDRLASEIFSLEASTKTAPGLRSSSAAISLAGNRPAILLSLAISSSLHGRLEVRAYAILPFKFLLNRGFQKKFQDSELDARVTPEPRSCELSASDQTVSNREQVAMCRELCGCSYGYGHANSPRRFHPNGGAGFFIAVSINRRGIVFDENSASEMTGSRG